MSKVIIADELLKIIEDGVKNPDDHFDNPTTRKAYIEALGQVVADFFGADLKAVSEPQFSGDPDPELSSFACHFTACDSTPSDGGIFRKFDTDVSVEDWFEESGVDLSP